MIIVDINQVCIANLFKQLGEHTNAKLEENLLRHMILNSLRGYNSKFKKTYGEMVIACDDKKNWRKNSFSNYKAHRKKDRDESDLDWNTVFQTLDKLKLELKEFFPYRVIQVDYAEADDIIATLCDEHGKQIINGDEEKILIISSDKDFIQLQKYANVFQYDPIKDKMITHPNPYAYMKEHILRGDRGDGIPNILSNDDVIVSGGRQRPMSTKKVEEWINKEPEEFCDTDMLRNWHRNELLINLSNVPDNIKKDVINKYNEESGKNRSKLFNYFVNNKLSNLMEHIGDF